MTLLGRASAHTVTPGVAAKSHDQRRFCLVFRSGVELAEAQSVKTRRRLSRVGEFDYAVASRGSCISTSRLLVRLRTLRSLPGMLRAIDRSHRERQLPTGSCANYEVRFSSRIKLSWNSGPPTAQGLLHADRSRRGKRGGSDC